MKIKHLFIIVIGICITIPLAIFIGRMLKMDTDQALLIGVGNVDKILVSQIQEQYEYLKKEHFIFFK